MRLPGADRAVVEIEKLRDYCLSPTHPRGRHKARVFASSLHILQADVDWLRTKLLEAARHNDAVETDADEFGTRYVVDFDCSHRDKTARVRSAWIVRRQEDFPRLSTCYVLSE